MNKRMTDTEIWNQRWFKRMSPGNKLVYFYVKDHCNHAGIWSIDIIQLMEDIGVEEFDIQKFLEQVNRDFDPITGQTIERVRFKMVGKKYLWMVGYITFHWGGKNGKCSQKYASVGSALDILEGHGILMEALDKGYITLNEPLRKGTYKDNYKGKGKDRSNNKGQENFESINSTPLPDEFQNKEFITAYQGYIDYMEEKGEGVTPKKTEADVNKIFRLLTEGNDPIEVINQTISANNKSFYELKKFESNTKSNGTDKKRTKGDRHVDFFTS